MWQLRHLWAYPIFYVYSRHYNTVHSPFLFELFRHAFDRGRQYYHFALIEKERQNMLRSDQLLEVEDFGALSTGKPVQLGLSRIVGRSSSSPDRCAMASRMVSYLKPDLILELGTNAGILTSYMAMARGKMRIITIEGSNAIAKCASQLFQRLEIENVELHNTRFEDALASLHHEDWPIDLLIMDGNHTYEATIRYFDALEPRLSARAVVFVDDIRWSYGMLRAWRELISRACVRASADFYTFGLLFTSPDFLQKLDLQLLLSRLPWRQF